ncbi:MAG: CBS domain-containing protein [Oscillospiraceae bacterium]
MKVKDCMSRNVDQCRRTGAGFSVAARLMSRYNLGVLPVQAADGRLCGMLTDRDVVLRCVAAGTEAPEAVARAGA